jgi:F-type H+-transporting ATPase subunit a
MHEISIKAEEIFHIGAFPVTNALLLSLVTLIILVGVGLLIRHLMHIVPGRLQSLFELVTEQVLELMESVLGSRTAALRYFPLIASIFLFICVSNWLGLFPGVGSIGIVNHLDVEEHAGFIPLFRAPASDLNFTIALAMISVVSVNGLGMIALGARRYVGKFFTIQSPILSFVGILEFISEFVKIVSFSFRLFGNVFAGEVLLMIIGFLVPYFIPLPFLFLEIFVGFIQAFIFSMLTLVFVAGAVVSHDEH